MLWIFLNISRRTEAQTYAPDSEKIKLEFMIMQYEQAMETFRHGVTSLCNCNDY